MSWQGSDHAGWAVSSGNAHAGHLRSICAGPVARSGSCARPCASRTATGRRNVKPGIAARPARLRPHRPDGNFGSQAALRNLNPWGGWSRVGRQSDEAIHCRLIESPAGWPRCYRGWPQGRGSFWSRAACFLCRPRNHPASLERKTWLKIRHPALRDQVEWGRLVLGIGGFGERYLRSRFGKLQATGKGKFWPRHPAKRDGPQDDVRQVDVHVLGWRRESRLNERLPRVIDLERPGNDRLPGMICSGPTGYFSLWQRRAWAGRDFRKIRRRRVPG